MSANQIYHVYLQWWLSTLNVQLILSETKKLWRMQPFFLRIGHTFSHVCFSVCVVGVWPIGKCNLLTTWARTLITALQRSCGKVLFSFLSVWRQPQSPTNMRTSQPWSYNHMGIHLRPWPSFTHTWGPEPVQTCSLWKAGSSPSTERPSCLLCICTIYSYI